LGKNKVLGGGLAAAAGTIHGIQTTTFNAAGVHWRTLDRHNATRDQANAYVIAYNIRGDILSVMQDRLNKLIPTAIGNRIELDSMSVISMRTSLVTFFKEGIRRHNDFKAMGSQLQ